MAFVTRQHSGVVLELLAKAASAMITSLPGLLHPGRRPLGGAFGLLREDVGSKSL